MIFTQSTNFGYQNTLGRRTNLGAYYHMSSAQQLPYNKSNEHTLSGRYGINNTWNMWHDGRSMAPSVFSAKPYIHRQKTRSFSIILTTAAFIVLLAIICIAAFSFYFTSVKSGLEDCKSIAILKSLPHLN